MLKTLHPRDDMNRLYMSRKEGRRGLASIEDCVGASQQGLKKYTKKSKERLITAACNSNGNIKINRKSTKTIKQKWEEKQLYGYFKQQTREIAHKKIWT